jgi:hypothetical protein
LVTNDSKATVSVVNGYRNCTTLTEQVSDFFFQTCQEMSTETGPI